MSNDGLNNHGQPLNRMFNRRRREDRNTDELIGLAKGIAADGVVNQAEAEFLSGWLERNAELRDTWPVNILYDRIDDMLCDGCLDQDEQAELLDLLHQFTGQNPPAAMLENWSSKLPFDQPMPKIIFEDRTFCFTGKFISGSRDDCRQAVASRGGRFAGAPSKKVDYLVIGILGSEDWAHTSYGRKIEKAMALKRKGHGIMVVSEDHWVNCVYEPDQG